MEGPLRSDPIHLKQMISALHHRGPDETGLYIDDWVGLAQSRLSIIDLAGGSQPMHNEDQSIWLVFNGEIFNYRELRPILEQRGHRFYTHSDTEVIIHAYEAYGQDCVHYFNGQWAFALWDCRKKEVFLARDRIGIRPLHYTVANKTLFFASEIKALFTVPEIPRQFDPKSLEQIFTFWTTLAGKTAFEGITELPPGHSMTIKLGHLSIRKYWDIPFCPDAEKPYIPLDQQVEQIQALLHDAIALRMRSDVPVGCYLSGGLDSSGITAKVVRDFNSGVQTFGIRFEEGDFDEGKHQQLMVEHLGVEHEEIHATNKAIGEAFGKALAACEKPLLRTAPIPLFLLSQKVHSSGFKVVLTGEGADEFFGGYNIYKEAKIRQCMSRFPQSTYRRELIGALYSYIFKDAKSRHLLTSFFSRGLDSVNHPLFSHLIRWENTRRTRLFFSDELKDRIGDYSPYQDLQGLLPEDFGRWDYFSRAQYLESRIFLSNYLLSSQGDRVAMAHSVEIRLPFLDYRIMEMMARVPSRWKMLGLKEKYLLKKVFADILPQAILERPKHPYRAPIVESLLKSNIPEHIEALSDRSIRQAGLFDPAKVKRLLAKLQTTSSASEVDSMALAGILSTQLLYHHFVLQPTVPPAIPVQPTVFIDRRSANRKAVLPVLQPDSAGRTASHV